MDITTEAGGGPMVPGINEIELRGYDLQVDPLTRSLINPTSMAGTFSGFFSGPRVDPAGGGFYDIVHARFSDGVHASPPALIRVISLNADSAPPGAGNSDGIPDDRMIG